MGTATAISGPNAGSSNTGLTSLPRAYPLTRALTHRGGRGRGRPCRSPWGGAGPGTVGSAAVVPGVTAGCYRTGSPVTVRPMMSFWISLAPSKIV
ncbi:hypothetical protein GCM10007079_37680 [Nocardiopsis terrae]|nr:hypothetical protein GCM10007079_37680 [Nocardiopsis terrae]